METKKILVCDGTIDGIFTAIYKAWEFRYGHSNTKIIEGSSTLQEMTMELFTEYIDIVTDYEVSNRVVASIQSKISNEAYEYVVRAALSCEVGRSDAIYRFLILGFHVGRRVVDYLSYPQVSQIYAMNRRVWNEVHHYLGFLRFQEMEGRVLYSVIHPKNDVLSLIAPHFSDRLQDETFMIYDEGRELAVIHQRQREAFLMEVSKERMELLTASSAKESEYEQLWKAFYQSVSIKERENSKLQQNNLPLRFRTHMTEFHS